MQLYILSPLLLFGLYNWGKKAAWAIVVGIVVLLSGCLFATQMVNHYSMSIKYVLLPLCSHFIYSCYFAEMMVAMMKPTESCTLPRTHMQLLG